jgi:hypothetical protein
MLAEIQHGARLAEYLFHTGAVGMRQTLRQRRGKKRPTLVHPFGERCEVGARHIAAWQRRLVRPFAIATVQMRLQLAQCAFGQPPIRCDLAAEH